MLRFSTWAIVGLVGSRNPCHSHSLLTSQKLEDEWLVKCIEQFRECTQVEGLIIYCICLQPCFNTSDVSFHSKRIWGEELSHLWSTHFDLGPFVAYEYATYSEIDREWHPRNSVRIAASNPWVPGLIWYRVRVHIRTISKPACLLWVQDLGKEFSWESIV